MEETDDGKVKQAKFLQLPRAWLILMTIRLLLNIFGQRSYIHPDEFFQGLEVVAGNIFDCRDSVFQAWEFQMRNESNQIQEPIRNIAVPYFFYGLPLMFLKFLNGLVGVKDYAALESPQVDKFVITPVQANTLVYYPRLFMTVCSLIIDFSLLKSSELLGLDGPSVLLTFATSYVAFTYLTRTFSNTIETILFSALIYLVLKSIKSQHVLSDKLLIATGNDKKKPITLLASTSDLINSTFQQLEPAQQQQQQQDSKTATLKRIHFFDIFRFDNLGGLIGLVVCIGVFNRPTFLFFAAVPVAYWLLYGLESCPNIQHAVSFIWRRLLKVVKYSLPCLVLLVLIDTCYYNKLNTLDKFFAYFASQDCKLIVTPINFFAYNLNTDQLKSHGEHPFYLHAIVNCTLLFGINHLILYLIFANFVVQLCHTMRGQTFETSTSRFKLFKQIVKQLYALMASNRFCFMLFSFLVPLMLLSCAPHQEPRFLLPLIVPLVLLTGHCIFGKCSYLSVRLVWLAFNLIGLSFYGFAHQGGLVSSLGYVQKMFTHPANLQMDQHVIFYQTYMPPRFMVMAPWHANMIKNNRHVYEKARKVMEDQIEEGHLGATLNIKKYLTSKPPARQIYELMSSANSTHLNELILSIKSNYSRHSNSKIKKNFAIFLVAPSVLDQQLNKEHDETDECSLIQTQPTSSIAFLLHTQFKLHFSFEHLDKQIKAMKCLYESNETIQSATCLAKKCRQTNWVIRFLNSFSLNFYQVIL